MSTLNGKSTISNLDTLRNFIEKYSLEDFNAISLDTYKLAASNSYYKQLVEISLKSLQKTDPEKANIEQAAKVADQMQAFARQKLKELEQK